MITKEFFITFCFVFTLGLLKRELKAPTENKTLHDLKNSLVNAYFFEKIISLRPSYIIIEGVKGESGKSLSSTFGRNQCLY